MNADAIAVNESQIEQSFCQTYRQTGVWICPEGAATIAALEQAIDHQLIKPKDRVVAFNTGSFEKYLPNLRHLVFS